MKKFFLFPILTLSSLFFDLQAATDTEASLADAVNSAQTKIMANFVPMASFESAFPDDLQYEIARQRLNLHVFGLLGKGKEKEALPSIILLAESGDLTWKIYYAHALYEGRPGLTKDQTKARILYDEIKADPFFTDEENEPDNFMKEGLEFLKIHLEP